MDIKRATGNALAKKHRNGIELFGGADDEAAVAKRRAKNKRAKASRKANRKKG